MEIKKYVLLDDKNIIIKRWGLWLRDDDNMIIDGVGKPHGIGIMIKTSDNILDLVEVGDLVELLYTGNDKYYKLEVVRYDDKTLETTHMIIETSSFKVFIHSRDDLNVKLPFCKAIYKKQPNGDYKRYEVKEK